MPSTVDTRRFCAVVSTLVLLVSFASHPSFGQNDLGADVARPVQGVGHDYISSFLSETVNPGTGTLSIRIPLPAPKARGFSLPMVLTYDSGQVNHFVHFFQAVAGWCRTVQPASQAVGRVTPSLIPRRA